MTLKQFAVLTLIPMGLALSGVGSCAHIVEDTSAGALASGEATILLGGCEQPLRKGWEHCAVTRGKPLPILTLAFTNPADYAVSDCEFGIFKTGSVAAAQIVEIDIAPLAAQIAKVGFCLLKVEATERYPDPRDPKQLREIPLGGGFFVEAFDPGYLPVPPPQVTSWCYKVSRTNKGRALMETCK